MPKSVLHSFMVGDNDRTENYQRIMVESTYQTHEVLRRIATMYPLWNSVARFYGRQNKLHLLHSRIYTTFHKEFPHVDWDFVGLKVIEQSKK